MIGDIIKLVKETPYGKSDIIDQAKGKYKRPSTFKELILKVKQIVRND
jgi:hypothetical protein